jgi:hypothetical protein
MVPEERMFKRREAEELLPLIENLLRSAVLKKKQLEEVNDEFSRVQNRILLYGGILPPYRYLSEAKGKRDALMEGLQEDVARIEQTGCVIKDLDTGLVDFPSMVADEQVYLCWKLGEERIGYWHRMDEGFAGRKPLSASGEDPSDDRKPN